MLIEFEQNSGRLVSAILVLPGLLAVLIGLFWARGSLFEMGVES